MMTIMTQPAPTTTAGTSTVVPASFSPMRENRPSLEKNHELMTTPSTRGSSILRVPTTQPSPTAATLSSIPRLPTSPSVASVTSSPRSPAVPPQMTANTTTPVTRPTTATTPRSRKSPVNGRGTSRTPMVSILKTPKLSKPPIVTALTDYSTQKARGDEVQNRPYYSQKHKRHCKRQQQKRLQQGHGTINEPEQTTKKSSSSSSKLQGMIVDSDLVVMDSTTMVDETDNDSVVLFELRRPLSSLSSSDSQQRERPKRARTTTSTAVTMSPTTGLTASSSTTAATTDPAFTNHHTANHPNDNAFSVVVDEKTGKRTVVARKSKMQTPSDLLVQQQQQKMQQQKVEQQQLEQRSSKMIQKRTMNSTTMAISASMLEKNPEGLALQGGGIFAQMVAAASAAKKSAAVLAACPPSSATKQPNTASPMHRLAATTTLLSPLDQAEEDRGGPLVSSTMLQRPPTLPVRSTSTNETARATTTSPRRATNRQPVAPTPSMPARLSTTHSALGTIGGDGGGDAVSSVWTPKTPTQTTNPRLSSKTSVRGIPRPHNSPMKSLLKSPTMTSPGNDPCTNGSNTNKKVPGPWDSSTLLVFEASPATKPSTTNSTTNKPTLPTISPLKSALKKKSSILRHIPETDRSEVVTETPPPITKNGTSSTKTSNNEMQGPSSPRRGRRVPQENENSKHPVQESSKTTSKRTPLPSRPTVRQEVPPVGPLGSGSTATNAKMSPRRPQRKQPAVEDRNEHNRHQPARLPQRSTSPPPSPSTPPFMACDMPGIPSPTKRSTLVARKTSMGPRSPQQPRNRKQHTHVSTPTPSSPVKRSSVIGASNGTVIAISPPITKPGQSMYPRQQLQPPNLDGMLSRDERKDHRRDNMENQDDHSTTSSSSSSSSSSCSSSGASEYSSSTEGSGRSRGDNHSVKSNNTSKSGSSLKEAFARRPRRGRRPTPGSISTTPTTIVTPSQQLSDPLSPSEFSPSQSAGT